MITETATTPAGGLAGGLARAEQTDRAIGAWLAICAALVYAMVVLGGVTRLTGSGLSMVEWQPILGWLPPTSEAGWQEAFANYRASPEYRQVNVGMSLAQFQMIYGFEYAHRLLGRLIGVAFLLPLLGFLAAGRLSVARAGRLGGIFLLGGLQGLLGWYMVKSGLVDVPRVSPYRLAAHLGLALVIYALILWQALAALWPRPAPAGAGARRGVDGMAALLGLTLLAGAFVAGNKAGLAYNSFPLMAGQWVPDGLAALSPWWRNLFENITTVQFVHRLLAVLTVAWALLLALRLRALGGWPARLGMGLALLTLGQAMVGVATLLAGVPVVLGALHQGAAIAVLSVLLATRYALGGSRVEDSQQPATRM